MPGMSDGSHGRGWGFAFGWDQVVEEYRRAKQVEGLQEASIYETRLILRHFERLVGP